MSRQYRLELADVDGLEEPVTRAVPIGESTKTLDEILGAGGRQQRGALRTDAKAIVRCSNANPVNSRPRTRAGSIQPPKVARRPEKPP